jgi:hypothetical protein
MTPAITGPTGGPNGLLAGASHRSRQSRDWPVTLASHRSRQARDRPVTLERLVEQTLDLAHAMASSKLRSESSLILPFVPARARLGAKSV